MAVVRVEFANAGQGLYKDGVNANVIERMVGTATLLTVTGTATVAGSRPVAPADADTVVINVISGNAIAAVGGNPTATQTNGKVALEGWDVYLATKPGEMVSLIELDLT